jgi:hypothetical protein
MSRSLINRRFGLRNSLRWLSCFLFLFSSGGFVLSLESSGVNPGSRRCASVTAWEKQSVQGANESGCTNPEFTPAATSPEVVGSLPIHSAVSDFNLDGKPDLAVPNNNSNTLAC